MSFVKPFNPHDLDQRVLVELNKYPKLIEAADDYLGFADRGLVPKLMELAKISNKVQPYPKKLKLYRGFGGWRLQENMGITSAKVGDIVNFKSDDKVLSTSTDRKIAEEFGHCLVETEIDTQKQACLMFTIEIAELVRIRRNLKAHETLDEVIILPPFDLQLKVLTFRNKTLLENWFS